MRVALAALAMAYALGACDREMRHFSSPPTPHEASPGGTRQSPLQPGQPGRGISQSAPSRNFMGDNAYAMSQGKKLFRWYNCSGCHSNGGGGMGPPLMDNQWRYGHEPEQVFATIMDGRPNGMPSFRGRIPDDQAWQLVAYVRSMSGLAAKAALPGRSDALSPGVPESRRPRLEPRAEPPEKRG